jgi:hypothetical protein
MSEQVPLNVGERELETRLRRLVPSGHGLRRDNLMFQAGRRAGRRQLLPWQGMSAVLLVGCMALGWLSVGPEPRPDRSLLVQVEPVVESAPPVTDRSAPSQRTAVPARVTHPSEYLRLRELVLLEGADALPNPPAAAVPETIDMGADWPRGMPTAAPPFHRFRSNHHGDRS